MRSRFPDQEWSLDLSSEDKVLENHGVPDDDRIASEVLKTLEETGFRGSWIKSGDNNL